MLSKTIFSGAATAAFAVSALSAQPPTEESATAPAPEAIVHPAQWPEVAFPTVLTEEGEAHVQALLAQMTLEQCSTAAIRDLAAMTLPPRKNGWRWRTPSMPLR
jgi:beta-glucosidase